MKYPFFFEMPRYEGALFPSRIYGLAWYRYDRDTAILCWIPFNFILGWLRSLLILFHRGYRSKVENEIRKKAFEDKLVELRNFKE